MIDTDEQDHEFFDILYQQWSQTTGAKDRYLVVKQVSQGSDELWEVYSTSASEPDDPWFVATFNSEADADFFAGLHGAVPDLIRRLHEAVDEATRKDESNDLAQGQLAEALLENHGLQQQILELEEFKHMYEGLCK